MQKFAIMGIVKESRIKHANCQATVVVTEDDEAFEVSPEDERALLAAIAQAERGQVISWEELREQLRRFG